MIEIELDGHKVGIAEGSTVMHAAEKAGTSFGFALLLMGSLSGLEGASADATVEPLDGVEPIAAVGGPLPVGATLSLAV